MEIEVRAQRIERFTVRQEEPDGTDIAMVGTPLDQRHAILVGGSGGMTRGQVVEHQVGSSVCNPIEHLCSFRRNSATGSMPDGVGGAKAREFGYF
ncbi:MAG TPA: hypothetical protein VFD07_08070 [Candidatus Krumholzibacteria bacterium]|nr:hypothetical protein [Candidatus Krumholzibacteria bacterium]